MKPLVLEISAFGPYKGSETIDFCKLESSGLFLVTGKTGAGKSTIFDAISYALYGKVSTKDRDNIQIRSHFSDVDTLTKVKLSFILKGRSYEIERIPQQEIPKKRGEGTTVRRSEITLKEIESGKTYTQNDAESKIVEIMGIDSDQFRKIIMIPQGEFREFLFSGTKEKKEILSKLFATHAYERFENEIDLLRKEKSTQLETLSVKVKQVTSGIILPEGEILDEANPVRELEKAIEKFENLHAQEDEKIKSAQSELSKASMNLEKSKEKNARIEEYEKAVSEYEAHLERKAQIDDKLGIVKLAIKAQPVYLKEEKFKEAQSQLENLQNELKKKEEENKKALARHEKAKKDKEGIADIEKDLRALRLEHDNASGSLKTAKELLSKRLELESIEKELRNIRNERELAFRLIEKDRMRLEELHELSEKSAKASIELSSLKPEYEKLLEKENLENERKKKEKLLDDLIGRLSEAKHVMTLSEQEYERLNNLLISGYSGYLAKKLEEGSPCPVCGSIHHPSKAPVSKEYPTQEMIDIARGKSDESRKVYSDISLLHKAADTELRKIVSDLDKLSDKDLSQMDTMKAALDSLEESAKLIDKCSEESKELKEKQAASSENLSKQDEAITKKSEMAVRLDSEIRSKMETFEGRSSDAKDIGDRIESLGNQIEEKEKAKEGIEKEFEESGRLHASTESTLKMTIVNLDSQMTLAGERKEIFDEFFGKAGFKDITEYESSKMSQEQIQLLQDEIKAYEEQELRLKTVVEEKRTSGEGERIDLGKISEEISAMEANLRSARSNLTELYSTISRNKASLAALRELYESESLLRVEYADIMKLYNTFKNNSMKISFETYVLIEYFNEVVELANRRFRILTDNRYEMSRLEERSKYGSSSGLDLEVFDYNTGKKRSIKTLSGGESFKASLCLALALSELVQMYSGNIRLDTLFIDEGFGSLDPESLEKAIQVLLDLRTSDRLIGIISHVQELKDRIKTRIEVSSGFEGSSTRIVNQI